MHNFLKNKVYFMLKLEIHVSIIIISVLENLMCCLLYDQVWIVFQF